MSKEDGNNLEKMVSSSSFFDLPEVLPAHEKGADNFQYRLTVESEKQKHTVEMSEVSVPDKLRPLIDLMMKESRKTKSTRS